MEESYTPATGARHVPDERDYPYRNVMGSVQFDWERGYDANDELGIPRMSEDQGTSVSCVGQGCAKLCRAVWKKFRKALVRFSPKWIYSHIHLPGGGAYIRDGVKFVCNVGPVSESSVPSYDGGKPPSESFMRDCGDTPELLSEAKSFAEFDYRALDGSVDDIETFARAIRDCHGVNGGFTGTNPGWCRSDVRDPAYGESQWNHDVELCAAGLMDVDGYEFAPKGTKCVFTENSWGGRYTITEGRWKGYQAIPERYFRAHLTPSAAPGEFVFVGYVLYRKADTPDDVRRADLLKRFDRRILFNTGKDSLGNDAGDPDSGKFGWVYDGLLRVAPKSDDRAALMALMAQATGVTSEDWAVLPKIQF